MKKKYEKPVMVSEEFAIGNHIAHGGCNHKPGTGPDIKATVSCIHKTNNYNTYIHTHTYDIIGDTIKDHGDYDKLLDGIHTCGDGGKHTISAIYHKYNGQENPHKLQACNPFSS